MIFGEEDAGVVGLKWALRLDPKKWVIFHSYKSDEVWSEPTAKDCSGEELKKELRNTERYKIRIHIRKDR